MDCMRGGAAIRWIVHKLLAVGAAGAKAHTPAGAEGAVGNATPAPCGMMDREP